MNDSALFPILTPQQIEELKPYGDVVALDDGALAFEEGEVDYSLFVVLEGQIRVTKKLGQEDMTLAVHTPGHFSGDIGLVSQEKAGATGRAVGPTWLLRVRADAFRRLVADSPDLAGLLLKTMTSRSQEVEAQVRQQEKMAALGKMSAGLAHELNNPASAAMRSASELVDSVKAFVKESLKHDSRFSAPERDRITELLVEIVQGRKKGCILSPLQRSDREGSVADWLEEAGIVEEVWDTTSLLIDSGVTQERLESLKGAFDAASLSAALAWIQSAIRMAELAINIEQSTRRISDLVRAMKQYSHMDQATLQVVNVNESLDTTLTIFGHRLRQGIRVERDYDVQLPSICAYAGELTQVWTNVIDNAIDAMKGEGTLRVRTAVTDGNILVEIGDSGPGIPQDVQPRIFEPFFTTKPIGKGTGLGLDISYRIVHNRHHGTLKVESKPGDTRFQIRLPLGGVLQAPTEDNPAGTCAPGV